MRTREPRRLPMRLGATTALWLSALLAAAACGTSDRATPDSAASDTPQASTVPDTAAAPRVVPYDPSAPGPMRSGDRPIDATTPAGDAIGDPAAVVRDYYAAIRAHDFMRAYRMWEVSGESGVRSYARFEAGFDSTETVDAKVDAPGRVEGAAGSRYVTVPVQIDARLRNGTRQRFTGTYTLRRVVVPGASAAQRRWHLYAANIRQVQ